MGFSPVRCQEPLTEDVVYLKNGGVIRGVIVEQVPGETLKIKTRDGNVFVYAFDEVEKLTREEVNEFGMAVQYVPKKSGGTAFILSLLITGGGQFYNGETGKGVAMLGMGIVGIALVISGTESTNDGYSYESSESEGQVTLGAMLWLGAALWSVIDAPISSARINRENGFASLYRVSDDLYVDVELKRIESRNTPYVKAVLSF